MNRRMSTFAGTVLFLAPFMMGQQAENQSQPGFREDTLSARQLIAWTWMQQPKPLPEALPTPDKNIPPADQSPNQTASLKDGKQIFVGKIARSRDHLVLASSDGNTYPLRQNDAIRYEGRNVRISGILDASDQTIQIVTIEILS